MSITLTQLRSFLAVMRGGSVTAAADELVVTQPSVSAAVAALSRELGTPVTEREGRGIRPTAAGNAFAPFAADVIGLLEEGRRAAREAAHLADRRLRLAAVTTAAESFVPPLMRAFAQSNDSIGLTLAVGNREQVLDLVLDHRADVAIGGRPPRDPRVQATPILPNDFVLITAPDDPHAAGSTVDAAELERRVWLMREPGSGTRIVNEEFLAAAALEPQTLTLGSNGAIKQAARAGLGIAFISRAAVALELDHGLLASLPVRHRPASRRWYAMCSTVGPRRAAVERFMTFAASPTAREALASGSEQAIATRPVRGR
ncbi:MAG: LysR family transcriptional regulator [Solirubrobacteraceae bacterium]|nr:LysR family transcriptional regulator [Solirubrobacteraceae bacterium]